MATNMYPVKDLISRFTIRVEIEDDVSFGVHKTGASSFSYKLLTVPYRPSVVLLCVAFYWCQFLLLCPYLLFVNILSISVKFMQLCYRLLRKSFSLG